MGRASMAALPAADALASSACWQNRGESQRTRGWVGTLLYHVRGRAEHCAWAGTAKHSSEYNIQSTVRSCILYLVPTTAPRDGMNWLEMTRCSQSGLRPRCTNAQHRQGT